MLEKIVAGVPDEVDAAVRLSLAYEQAGMIEAIQPLLEKHQDQLGTGEGARMLGQIYAHSGRSDEAFPMLEGYLEPRIAAFRDASVRLDATAQELYQEWSEYLNEGRAGDAFYRQMDSIGDETEKQIAGQQWIYERMESDPVFVSARNSLTELNQVVPVAIDFGFLQLTRAQQLADSAQRKVELENAEKTFLSVQAAAGESDEYRLFLAQVYFWLGRKDDANALFDSFLESNNRSHEALALLSATVRDLGDFDRCRDLLDEAYESATEPEHRQAVARQRAAATVETAQRIEWLRKCGADPEAAAALHLALGDQAREIGHDDEAVTHLKRAVDAYAKLPESAVTLNNAAGASGALFRLTGNLDDYRRSTTMLSKAAGLMPNDTVILANVGHNSTEGAVLELLADKVNLKRLSGYLDFSSLPFLYSDDQGRREVYAAITANRQFQKGLDYFRQVTKLAPNNLEYFGWLANYLFRLRDGEGLGALLQRLEGDGAQLRSP